MKTTIQQQRIPFEAAVHDHKQTLFKGCLASIG